MVVSSLLFFAKSISAQDSLFLKHEKGIDTTIQHQTSSSNIKSSTLKFSIEGQVKDYTTGEPLSFATITFTGKAKGVKASVDGMFFYEANELPSDSISISSIGYKKITIPLDRKPGYRFYKIEMERTSVQMKNFVMHVSKDPALSLIKKVIKHKPQNNYNKVDNYSYEVYNKLEMDINKIPKKSFKVSPLLKNFSFVQNFIDSTSDDKPFLPLFLTETISDYYYQQKPKKMRELIKGSRISGYKNQSVSQMLGAMYQNLSVYDNQMPVFNVLFTSPIADDAPFFYKYQITDTQFVNGKRCFQVVFTPKRKGEHTFEGDIWVHDSDYAVQKVNMIVGKDQNINWVNKVTMLQEFTCLHDSIWFLTRDKFYVDFLPPHGDKVAGFLGRKTSTYKNIVINHPHNIEVLNDKSQRSETDFQSEALNRDEQYWNEVRHDTLSKNEKSIYKMIDTIQGLPIYKRYYSISYLLATGIKEVGPLEIGPIYNLYSKNAVEGVRWRLTLGTTPKLFKNIYLKAYVAYGSKDTRFKYYGSALWLLERKPRMYIYAEYKHDIDNAVNSYDDAGAIDNVFGAIGRKKVPWKLAFTDQQRIEFFKSYFNGFSFKIFAEKRIFTPYSPLPYDGIFFNDNGLNTSSVSSNEIGLELRFAYREKFVEGNYYRTSLGTEYPIIKGSISKGFKNVLGGNYNYTKLRFTVSDSKKLNHFGSIHYNIYFGKVIGILPYSLLEVHPGNEFYYYNPRAFNMMYRYEYVSDQYIGASIEHSMGTLFFKYIPVVKKMKLRTFWNMKGVYGSLSSSNQNLNLNRGYTFQTLVKSPYLEAGTGIENIFKVLRVDFVWRLLPTKNVNESDLRRFGIFGSMKFAF
ncbi:MAG: carboxypeptidase-like regulatory domain-containing protein [Bacteroidetes bacterium]|nr:carboxypeptidase-like regulatory domain-containing protein [Bacteroidota bacterium]